MTQPCTCMKRRAVAKAVSCRSATVDRDQRESEREREIQSPYRCMPSRKTPLWLSCSTQSSTHQPLLSTPAPAAAAPRDGREEGERKDPGRKRGQKGGMKLASSTRRMGVCGGRGGGGRGVDKWTGRRLRGGWGRG